jgi:hypothetical protein
VCTNLNFVFYVSHPTWNFPHVLPVDSFSNHPLTDVLCNTATRLPNMQPHSTVLYQRHILFLSGGRTAVKEYSVTQMLAGLCISGILNTKQELVSTLLWMLFWVITKSSVFNLHFLCLWIPSFLLFLNFSVTAS